jgi:prolyl-tRNA synthetase
MKYSKLVAKTTKTAPHDADSANARLLVQAGFINQLMAGVYTYLPLGLRVLDNIKNIVREEMNAVDGQEIYMPALTPKENWEKTNRYDSVDINFKLEGAGGKEYVLGSTHEEVVTPLVQQYVKSYKDLPVSVYQIQDKFRNEARAKSGLLRGREFAMKDMYSFHIDEEDFEQYYQRARQAYHNVFNRCGIEALYVEADGGAFSKFSHEFQTPTENGEDTIYACEKCQYAQNKEISEFAEGDDCPKCDGTMKELKTIEVGNIFPLKTKFSDAFDFKVMGEDGKPLDIIMGCYGIGPSRVMGAIVEVNHDERGMIWPKSVAPMPVHLVSLKSKDEAMQERIMNVADALYEDLQDAGIEVLWDERENKSPGEKFADADLIGLPLRLVVSEKTLKEDAIEWKERASAEMTMINVDEIKEKVEAFVKA